MGRVERGHIEYEVPRGDGDPLAEFADEPEGIDAAPSTSTHPAAAELPSTPQQSALPAQPVNSIWSKWAAAGIIAGSFAALAAGALYVNYPKWSARPVATTTREGSEQLTGRSPAEERRPAAERPGDAPSNSRQQTEHPTATNGQTAPSAIASNASRPSETARNSPASDARRTPGPAADATDSDFGSLTGQWSVNTRVESSSLRRYKGLRFVYQVRLQQVGNQVTGDGYKLRENDRRVATKTPITLIGDVIGNRVVLNFQERGTRRMSGGRLVLDRESEDVLRGRFSSDAAKSSGVANAHR